MATNPAPEALKTEPKTDAAPAVVAAPVVEAKAATPAPKPAPVAPAPKIVAKAAAKKAPLAKKTKAVAKPVLKTVKKTVVRKPTKIVQPKAASIAVSKGIKTMNDTVKQVEETMKKTTADVTAKATEAFKDLNVRAKAAMEKAQTLSKDAVEFNKANLEAIVESGKIAVKGAQTAAQSAAEYGRKNFEATSALVKTAGAVKSPTELFKLQGDFARSQFDGIVAEMSKSTEFYMKLAGEIFQPIQARYSVAAEQMKTRLAA